MTEVRRQTEAMKWLVISFIRVIRQLFVTFVVKYFALE